MSPRHSAWMLECDVDGERVRVVYMGRSGRAAASAMAERMGIQNEARIVPVIVTEVAPCAPSLNGGGDAE